MLLLGLLVLRHSSPLRTRRLGEGSKGEGSNAGFLRNFFVSVFSCYLLLSVSLS